MADKGKGPAYPQPGHSLGPKDEDEPSKKHDEGRAVLTFSFLGPKCYAATSYPHPIEEVQRKNENEYRDIALSKGIPSSLFQHIEERVDRELQAAEPNFNRCFSLRPGCYFMHITCWRPETNDQAPQSEEDDFDSTDDGIWSVYSWTGMPGRRGRPAHRWRPGHDPAVSGNNAHPVLGRYAAHIGEHASGNISNLALGSSSSSFFMRLSADDRNWHYRFRGLPEACTLAVEESMTAGMLCDKECRPGDPDYEHCTYGLQHCKHGRLRAVTLGQGGSWIVYREETVGVDYDPRKLPPSLVKGLKEGKEKATKEGKEKGWVINQAVLNPNHALEYVLAYNNGRIYYSFHWSFDKDFRRIAGQWCASKGVEFQGFYHMLDDDDYPHTVSTEDVEPPPTPDSMPRSDDNVRLPRSDDVKYTRTSRHVAGQSSRSPPGEPQYEPRPPAHYPSRSEADAFVFPPNATMAHPRMPNPYLQQPFASTQHLVMQQMQDQIRSLEARLYQTQLQPPAHFYPPGQTMPPAQPQAMPQQQQQQQQHGYTDSYHRNRSELGERQDNDAESDIDQGPGPRRRIKGRARTHVDFDDGHEQGSKKGKKSWFSGLK